MKKKRGRPKGSKNKKLLDVGFNTVGLNTNATTDAMHLASVMTRQNSKEYTDAYENGWTRGYRAALKDVIKDAIGGF